MAKAQPRKHMKMPLPPVPNSSAPALPPRRGVPPPPPPEEEQDEYDEFSNEADEEAYDDFDVEDKSPPKPAFKPPAPPISEPEENYDEFAGSESPPPSGPSIYMIGDDPPPPPPPPTSRPKLPKPPAHEEETYMDPDDDENVSAGSTKSNSSTGSSGPPLPTNRIPELPSRVEKPKKAGSSIFSLDPNTLTNVKSKLKNVGFNKKPEKKNDEEKPNIFTKALKPEKNSLPAKPTPPIKPPSQTSNLKNKFLTKFSSKPKDMPPVPPIPTDFNIEASSESHSHHSNESLEHSNSSHHEDQIDHSAPEVEEVEFDPEEMYDDATSLLDDPLLVHDWYHGMIDREESNKRLKSLNSDGAFLVRKSTKDKNQPCTLAVMYKSSIQNLKIRIRPDGKYALGEYKDNEVVFTTVPEVIEHHKKNDVILIGQKTGTVKLKSTPKRY